MIRNSYWSRTLPSKQFYKEDLAFIHDSGFRDFALKAAPGIVKILRRRGIHRGLIVDLGCGTGLLAEQLTRFHYDVLGIDYSQSMIRIARKRAPLASFRTASLFRASIPPCHAVTSTGECLNYLFDRRDDSRIHDLFRRVYKSLVPGGVFIFDIAEPGQLKQGTATRHFMAGKNWFVLVEKEEAANGKFVRRITTFRKSGKFYRKSHEVHDVQLFHAAEIARELRKVGFKVRVARSYGDFRLRKAHAVLIAHKAERART